MDNTPARNSAAATPTVVDSAAAPQQQQQQQQQRARRKAAVSAASREDPALVSYDGDDANNDGDGNHEDGRSLNHSANVGQSPSAADDARRIHGPASTSTTSSSSTSAVVVVHKDLNKGYPRGAYVGGGGGGGSDDAGSGYNSSSSGGNSHGKRGGHQHHNSKKKTALSAHAVEYLKNWMMSPEHVDHPYPTEDEKLRIMSETGIVLKQLTNWFVNNRKRFWKPKVKDIRSSTMSLTALLFR